MQRVVLEVVQGHKLIEALAAVGAKHNETLVVAAPNLMVDPVNATLAWCAMHPLTVQSRSGVPDGKPLNKKIDIELIDFQSDAGTYDFPALAITLNDGIHVRSVQGQQPSRVGNIEIAWNRRRKVTV